MRVRIISQLGREGPASITNLTTRAGVTRQAVTKHLRVLEKAGVVRSKRCGRESVWQLERRRLEEARQHLDAISRQWDSTLDRLRQFVEE
jgi:DNA-binding transcriptional ArsR family regulator